MKKLLLLLILIATPAFADRADEIKAEIEQKSIAYNQHQQEIQKLQVDLVKLQGALEEVARNSDSGKVTKGE